MMELTRASWNKYVRQLGEIDQRAGQLMADYIQQVGTADTQKLIQFAVALVNRYGAASSALAARFYDEMAQASGLTLLAAEPAEVSSYVEVARAVNGTISSPANTRNAVSRMVKQAGADTILKNAKRDGAEFAWVPNGDTCAFCIALASRGWQKASKAAIKGNHAEHIHANCDCNYCIRFNSKTTVEGYDPDSYLEMYENAEGGTPQEKINAMRRQIRQGNREKVNRQKREAYAARKGLASGQKGATIATAEVLSKLIESPELLGAYTPEALKQALEAAGLEVKPLSRGSLKGIRFEDGGGFKVNFGNGGLLQYHPEANSHHGGAYYKISAEGETNRYDTEGKKKQD